MASPVVGKLNRALAARLKGFKSGLARAVGHGRVTGYIVSSDFDRLSHEDRQALLSSLLGEVLTAQEQSEIGPIVTMSPAEADIGDTAA